MNNKPALLKISLLSALLLNSTFSYAAETSVAERPKTIDQVVAIVNDDVITNSDLVKQTDKILKQFKNNRNELPPLKELRKQLLNAMILDDLQLQLANTHNISASPQEVANHIENIANQRNMQVYEFKQMLQKEGIDYKEFQADLSKKLTIMNLQRAAVQSQIKISDRELAQALKLLSTQDANAEYRLSHILISVPDEPTSEKIKFAKNRAEDLVKELSNGKSFSSVAKVASDGQQALQGGDLGWFSLSQLPTIFADIAPKLKKGEIFGPIQSENGFHIVKLADVKHAAPKYQEQKFKVRHILIKKDEITTDAIAKKELTKIKKEIEQKNNFGDLALIYSDDVTSASTGGSIGWITKNMVVPEFANAIDHLKVNQISEPFESSYGWHIAQLLDKKTEDSTSKLQKMQARQIIQEKKFQDAVAKWQNKVRSEAHVKILI